MYIYTCIYTYIYIFIYIYIYKYIRPNPQILLAEADAAPDDIASHLALAPRGHLRADQNRLCAPEGTSPPIYPQPRTLKAKPSIPGPKP